MCKEENRFFIFASSQSKKIFFYNFIVSLNFYAYEFFEFSIKDLLIIILNFFSKDRKQVISTLIFDKIPYYGDDVIFVILYLVAIGLWLLIKFHPNNYPIDPNIEDIKANDAEIEKEKYINILYDTTMLFILYLPLLIISFNIYRKYIIQL